MTIPEKEKVQILCKAIGQLLSVAKLQLDYIDSWKSVTTDDKSEKHYYIFSTVENFWKNIELALHLGEDRFSHFAFYPVRTCMETFLQFNHFIKQQPIEQDNIAIKELLRSCVRYYKRAEEDGGKALYAKFYDQYASRFGYPPITKIKRVDDVIKTFPNIWDLCKEHLPHQSKILFFLYQTLCEGVHGRGIHGAIHNEANELEEYRRAIMQVYGFCKDMLVLLDNNYLGSKFKTKVLSAISITDNYLKDSVKLSLTNVVI